MKTYTESEMLAVWRRRLGYGEIRQDCTVEAYEGHDISGMLTEMIRSWYGRLLREAPATGLPVADVRPAEVTSVGSEVMELRLPDGCMRPMRVSAARWHRPAVIIPYMLAEPFLARTPSSYSPVNDAAPVAALSDDGTLTVAPLADGDAVTVRCVQRPAEGLYTLDEGLLNTIKAE